ncbi:MAG: hybrid sensor histidine kinase/response regulator [Opitutaceae bacterium]|nr:hybrid sensor histidine kinase/response regulator [Opitutaceae bacterium]
MLTEKNPEVAPPAAAEKPPVLVVDDEFGPRESIAFTLSGEFAVETAERAKEALAKIKAKEFDAVVMDIRMPEMDGIRAVEELRKIDPEVSVIMLTGFGTLLTAQQAMTAGANQYLRKPPDIAELIDAVRKQSAATRLRRTHAKAASSALSMNEALKREMAQAEPQVWQGRASVELVHDLNNPLTVVIGYAALVADEAGVLAQRDPALAKKLIEYARVVEKAAEYCRHLSENWRTASKQLPQFDRVDLVAIAQEVRAVIFFGDAAIEFAGGGEAWVKGSKFELMRIFQNLFKNALEAGATRLVISAAARDGKVELTVADNGAGMDADRVKRAMHGGFTSKASGTGLGLSICRHLAGAHGATFTLESEAGKGTTVRLTFPTVPQG